MDEDKTDEEKTEDYIVTDEAEKKRLLALTKLDIMISGLEGDDGGFFTAHGNEESVMVLLLDSKDMTVYNIKEGTKKERKELASGIRTELDEKFGVDMISYGG